MSVNKELIGPEVKAKIKNQWLCIYFNKSETREDKNMDKISSFSWPSITRYMAKTVGVIMLSLDSSSCLFEKRSIAENHLSKDDCVNKTAVKQFRK